MNVIGLNDEVTLTLYKSFCRTHLRLFHFNMSTVAGELRNNAWGHFVCGHSIPLTEKSMGSRLLWNDIKPDFDPLLRGLCGLLKSQFGLQLVIECCYFCTSFSGRDWGITTAALRFVRAHFQAVLSHTSLGGRPHLLHSASASSPPSSLLSLCTACL